MMIEEAARFIYEHLRAENDRYQVHYPIELPKGVSVIWQVFTWYRDGITMQMMDSGQVVRILHSTFWVHINSGSEPRFEKGGPDDIVELVARMSVQES